MEDLNKVKERIRNLLKLANDIHANVNEAKVAKNKAQDLMAKHGLTEADVFGYTKRKPGDSFHRPVSSAGSGMIEIDIKDLQMFFDIIEMQKSKAAMDKMSIEMLEEMLKGLKLKEVAEQIENLGLQTKLWKLQEKLSNTKVNSFITIVASGMISFGLILMEVILRLR